MLIQFKASKANAPTKCNICYRHIKQNDLFYDLIRYLEGEMPKVSISCVQCKEKFESLEGVI